ncbi:MAG: hypothetical protein GY856_55625 [bacterium]|nr:hypothetical protein [bacterium]
MDPITLAQRLRLGEDTRTEFKSVVRNRYRVDRHVIAKAVVALANTGGGVVVVGAEDDGAPSGIGTLQQADALMRQISQVCRDAVQPAIVCKLIKVRVDDETLLVVEVPAFAPERPYAAGGKYYVRDANRSREATRAELIRLLQSTDLHYDEQPVAGATLDELDLAAAQKLLAKAFEAPREDQVVPYLRALRCLNPENVPSVCGLLFFGLEPQRWLLDARISAVRVPGTEPRLELSDRQEITGTLTEQLAGARAFFDRHLSHPAQVAGWDRVEEPLLPDEVLREAVLNAVAHRDYQPASQVRIFFYDDRIEVINPGELLNRLTVESIRLGGISQKRNPLIASLLARLDQRENLGYGIPEMFRSMRQHGRPEPEIDVSAGHFRLVLRFGAGSP